MTGVQRLVIGDPFSGVMQVVLSICTTPEVVIVDDGTATMEFARQWMAGEHLARWHQVAQPGHRQQIARYARGQIAASVRRRIGPGSGCRLSVFTCLPVQLGQIPIVRNRYAWTRARFRAPQLKPAADLIGTSLVETGVVAWTPTFTAWRRWRRITESTVTSPTARKAAPNFTKSPASDWKSPGPTCRWRSPRATT